MSREKLNKILRIVCRRFDENRVPVAVIGAMALTAYGMPRFTADIDLLTHDKHRVDALRILKELGYNCFQEADSFAQFDSEMGVYGKIDLLFVATPEGERILERRTIAPDFMMGDYPVVQPDDYIILKLMAIANNPDRALGDAADILTVLKFSRAGQITNVFQPIDRSRIMTFADRFGMTTRMESLFRQAEKDSIEDESGGFRI